MSIKIKQRGPEIAFQCVILIWGVAIAYWVDFGFTRLTTQVSWVRLWLYKPCVNLLTRSQRFPIGAQGLFAIFSGGGLLFLPDTPRWYYAKDRFEEGDSILTRLWDRPLADPEVQQMRSSILASLRLEEQGTAKFDFMSLIYDNTPLKAGRRIRIAFLLMVIQQMMGRYPCPFLP